MPLIKTIRNRHDGSNIQGYFNITEAHINFRNNRAEIQGQIYISEQAFLSGLDPLDTFSSVINNFSSSASGINSTITSDVYSWLLALPEFQGATKR